jgi:site-specific recombinase XerD
VEVHRANVSDLARPEGAPATLKVQGKTGDRMCILRPDVTALLDRYLAMRTKEGLASEALVVALAPRCRGARLSRRSLDNLCNRAYARAGLPHRGCHVLRHSSASLALAAGAKVEHVRDFLGHRSIATTSTYLHALDLAANNPASLIAVMVSP